MPGAERLRTGYLVSFIHWANVGWTLHVPGTAEEGQLMSLSWPEGLPASLAPYFQRDLVLRTVRGFGLERHETFTFLSTSFSEGLVLFLPFSSWL